MTVGGQLFTKAAVVLPSGICGLRVITASHPAIQKRGCGVFWNRIGGVFQRVLLSISNYDFILRKHHAIV